MTTLTTQIHPLEQMRPLSENPAAVYLAGLKPAGRRTQQHALEVMARMLTQNELGALGLDWSRLDYGHTSALRSKLAGEYAPATVNKFISALKRTLKDAWRLGHMTAEQYQRAADLEAVTGETVPAGRGLSTGEILALMQACQQDQENGRIAAGTRDAAVIALLYAAGLRRDEVVKLDVENFNPETGALVVKGKRNKQRIVYLTNGALDALLDWLELRGSTDGALFVEVNKADKILLEREAITIGPDKKQAGRVIHKGGRMTSQAIYNLLKKRAREAKVKDFSPHDMRRSFISDLLDKGADIATVAKLAGHADTKTTMRYDRRPEDAKRKASELLHVPYKRK